MKKQSLRAFVLGLTFSACAGISFGCSSSDDEDPPYVPQASWGTCQHPFEAMDECSSLDMPLDWGNADGEKLGVFVARKRAQASPARAQLWLLQGGPGGTGAVFAVESGGQSEVDRLSSALPDVDIYIIEHRGVGYSSRLTCAEDAFRSEEGFVTCVNRLRQVWGSDLRFFTSQAAARDLAAATDATRTPGQGLFVYGVSYGTYWAIQYLKARPADATGVILDSVAAPGVQFFNDFPLQNDPVAQKLSALCAQDATCRAKMGGDPWARVGEILAGVDKRACADQLNAFATSKTGRGFAAEGPDYRLRIELGLVSALRSREVHTLIFPILYRLARCSPADVEALFSFFSLAEEVQDNGLAEGLDTVSYLDSDPLRYLIGGSEFYAPDAPPLSQATSTCDKALLCPLPSFDVFLRSLDGQWPTYTPPADVWSWPATSVPILAMNGELDPQTPVEKAASIEPNLSAPGQTFVRIPFATHSVLNSAPLRSDENETCGRQMTVAFVNDPSAPPATACLGDLVAPEFVSGPASKAYPPEFVEGVFGPGSDDIWGDTPPPAPPAASLAAKAAGPNPERAALIRRLRHMPSLR